MIKFFRNIRKSLLEQNKMGKYFKYAIGEIILVVIGILIALQINTWNEARIESKEEQKILANLKVDFRQNRTLLDSVIIDTKGGIQGCLDVLKYTGRKEKPVTSIHFDSLINKVFVTPSYAPVNGTLDELINSGKLGIIKNEALRKDLSSWKPILEIAKLRHEEGNLNETYLNQYIIKNGNWLNADQVSKVNRSVKFPKSGFIFDNRQLLNEQEFENLLENVAIGLDNYLDEIKKVSEILDVILEQLNEEDYD